MSERVDLVDATGVVKARSVERALVEHEPPKEYVGLHMQIVVVVVMNKAGQVLVHQRSLKKKVNPGDIDNVCGGITAGETPEEGARRETKEEAGVELTALHLVQTDINTYGRYRWLFVGLSEQQPTVSEPDDVEWAEWKSIRELKAAQKDKTMTFVDEFFEEVEAAQTHLKKENA